VSGKQRELLKQYFNNVIILGDNDDAGREMAKKLSNILGSSAINANLPESVKDVSDLSDEDLKKFVSQFDDLVANVLQ
jgi:DNA primase